LYTFLAHFVSPPPTLPLDDILLATVAIILIPVLIARMLRRKPIGPEARTRVL
jgi:hypothetical protein